MKYRIDKTKSIYQENRRLDTLAKLLTGNSVCIAVTFFNGNEKKLLISTNELNVHFKGNKDIPERLSNKHKTLGQMFSTKSQNRLL